MLVLNSPLRATFHRMPCRRNHSDCLYLDMNGIIHQCKQGKNDETEMMIAVFQYIEALVDIVRPKKYLFMGVDGTAICLADLDCISGVAPRAKQGEQRQRRWRTYAKHHTVAKPDKQDDDPPEELGEKEAATEAQLGEKETDKDQPSPITTEVHPWEWQCSFCTYINEKTVDKCVMCFSQRTDQGRGLSSF